MPKASLDLSPRQIITTVRIDPAKYAALKRVASADRRSVAETLRIAVDELVASREAAKS